MRTGGSRATKASATAIAGSTWPAVPPPASTTDNEESPVGSLTESFTRGADLPVLDGRVHDAGRCTAVRLHDAPPQAGGAPTPASGRCPQPARHPPQAFSPAVRHERRGVLGSGVGGETR